ncbi:MAG: 30S ribosomal protein S5 [Patescibacteria group bacterium]|nr:30S ribosomal protein S5 [Patescibacteria group bacterium]
MEEEKFESKVIEVKRVAKAYEGGKRIKVRAVVVAGNLKGKVGVGIAKGLDIADAIEKAKRLAEKNSIEVPIVDGTVPYEVRAKFASAVVLLKPTKKGRGLIAGSSVRTVLSLAGYSDVTTKILGATKNPLVNTLATLKALSSLAQSYQKKILLKEEIMLKNEN